MKDQPNNPFLIKRAIAFAILFKIEVNGVNIPGFAAPMDSLHKQIDYFGTEKVGNMFTTYILILNNALCFVRGRQVELFAFAIVSYHYFGHGLKHGVLTFGFVEIGHFSLFPPGDVLNQSGVTNYASLIVVYVET